MLCLLVNIAGAAQTQSEVPVNVYNWEVGSSTTLEKNIQVQSFDTKMLITEWQFDPAQSMAYPFGQAIEITTSDFTGIINTNTVLLRFYCATTPSTYFDTLLSDIIGTPATLEPNMVYQINMPNIETLPMCSDSLYIRIMTPTPGYGVGKGYQDINIFEVIPASPSIPSTPTDTYKLSDRGWETVPSANSLEVLNEGLTPCAFQTLRFNYNGFNYLTYPFNYPLEIENVIFQNYVPAHQLPGIYKLCYLVSANGWDNFEFDWFFLGITNIDDQQAYRRNVLTIHFAFQKSISYLLGELSFNPNTSSDWISALSYDPTGLWTNSDSDGNIKNEGATVSVVGHEVGHKLNHSFALGGSLSWSNDIRYFDEGFADIWATLIERYAYELPAPDYGIKSTLALNTGGDYYRNFRQNSAVSNNAFTTGNFYSQSRPLSHWFYLLSEGENHSYSTIQIGGSTPVYMPLYKYVCGLGYENSANIVATMFNNNIGGWEPTGSIANRYVAIRDFTLLAAGNLSLSDAQKAQIMNAWAAVNVGEPDFYVNPTPDYIANNTNDPIVEEWKVCKGSNITLTTGSILNAGNTWWQLPDGTNTVQTSTGPSTLSLNNLTTADGGLYTANISYSINGNTCTLQRVIELKVHDVTITANTETPCLGNTVTLTPNISPILSPSHIQWVHPSGATVSINPSTKVLTVNNTTSSHTGNYIIQCLDNEGNVINDNAANILITVIEAPVVEVGIVNEDNSFTPAATVSACSNSEITLYATGGDIFAWSNGSSNSTITIPVGTSSATYTVTVTLQACPDLSTVSFITVVPYAAPNPTISAPQTICPGQTATLTVNETFATYQWNTGATTQTISAATPGTYSVTVSDANGCTASASTTVTVNPQPQPNITMTQNECTVTLTASGGITYLWDNGSTNEAIEVAAPDTYTVIATDANGCTGTAAYEVLPADVAPTDFSGAYMIGNPANNISGVQQDANGNELWENLSLRIAGAITVPAGKTLTIKGGNLYLVGQNTKFIVQKGGILRIIDGATLQGDNCADNCWHGIRIEADATIAHPTEALTPNIDTNGSPNHGVVLVSGSTIKDAFIAIEDYDPTSPPPGGLDLPKGGGIILTDNQSTFENNLTGIKMNPFRPAGKYVQRSYIKNSLFQNNQLFVNPAYANYNYHQIELNSVSRVPIENNQFSANPATLTLQSKGTGIKAVNSGINIGTAPNGTPTPNTFTQLYKGIDVYNTLTSVSVTNIENNIFQEVTKALTLNYVPYAIVQNNSFVVPTGNESPHDSYAIYTLKAFGFSMNNNTFSTPAIANNNTRAVFINNAYFSDPAIANIRQNTFDGGFTDATRFEDDCKSLQLNCNVYVNAPQRDWYIAPDAKLDKQGQCEAFEPELSFHQHWHYLPAAIYAGYNHYHVVNESAFTLQLYHDDYEFSVPTYNLGYVDKYSCSFELSTPIGENPSCTISVPSYNDGSVGCSYSGEELSRKIRNWQRAEENDSIIALLHCIAEDWSYKILVGTYIDRRLYPQALAALDSIPNTPQGNADFKAIYYAYIQLLTGGSGKNSDAAFALQQTEQNRTHAQQTLAESMFALLYGNSYLRTVQDKAAHNTPFSSKPTFILAPNPTNNSAAIYWHNALVVSSDVFITDIAGRVLKTYHNLQNGQQINTDNLPNGIYYVHAAALSATQKLVVVH